jgi:hypothetical protein
MLANMASADTVVFVGGARVVLMACAPFNIQRSLITEQLYYSAESVMPGSTVNQRAHTAGKIIAGADISIDFAYLQECMRGS